MPWFRRRKSDSDVPAAAVEETAPRPEPAVVVAEPARSAAPDTTDELTGEGAKPKRRRGSRGGRNRKKPGETGAAAESAETSPKKPAARRQPAEKKAVSQRQERRRNEPRRRREPPRRAPLPAAKRELVVSVDVGEQRVAVLEDGRVAEVYLERPDRRSIAGNIYLGQVDNVLPGM